MVRLGTEVMELFARRNVSAERWHRELSPYLTPQAQRDYLYTDPINVPPTRLTGRARLVDLDSTAVAIVHVPTNAGLYAVVFARTPDDTWLADRIRPPETDVGEAG